MKTQTQHTPTPWKVQFYEEPTTGNLVGEIHADGVSICKAINTHTHSREWIQESDADLKFIIRAVNSHEALLEAAKIGLQEAKDTMEVVGGCDHSVNVCSCETVRRIEIIQSAIAQAEGE